MFIIKNKNGKKVKDQENLYFGFTCDSRMDYFAVTYESLHGKRGSIDDIVYGIHDRRGGGVCELKMVWYLIGEEKCPRLEVFSDYFDEITKDWHEEIFRQIQLLGKKTFTPEEFSIILINLGFEDMSDIKLETEKE